MWSSSTLSLTSTLYGDGWSTPRSGRFTPCKVPVLTVQEAGRAQGSVWKGVENLARIGIRSPDRPARSESLYRLRYPPPPHTHMYDGWNVNSGNYLFTTDTK